MIDIVLLIVCFKKVYLIELKTLQPRTEKKRIFRWKLLIYPSAQNFYFIPIDKKKKTVQTSIIDRMIVWSCYYLHCVDLIHRKKVFSMGKKHYYYFVVVLQ